MVDTVFVVHDEQVPTEDTRVRLVRAGVEIVDADGLEAVGLRAITRRAGVSHGAPRRYFPTHRALLAAIARTGIEDLIGLIDPILGDESTPASTRLVDAARAYVAFACERRAMFELMFRHDLLDGAGENLRSATVPLIERLRSVVAQATSETTTSSWESTLRMWSAMHGVAVLASNRALEPISDVARVDIDALVIDLVERTVESGRNP